MPQPVLSESLLLDVGRKVLEGITPFFDPGTFPRTISEDKLILLGDGVLEHVFNMFSFQDPDSYMDGKEGNI